MHTIKILLFIWPLFFSIQSLFSQREASKWYFGVEAGLDFNDGIPVPLLDGQLNTHEGCATISDRNGNLLFYTDGVEVWDKNHSLMPNGSDLLGHESSTQSVLIIPRAGSNNTQYYIFTVDEPDPEKTENHGLNYSLVDLSLNNGRGDVVTSEKNIHLPTYDLGDQLETQLKCAEKLTAVQHNDGLSIWVITHFIDSFYAFQVDANGVDIDPVISLSNTVVPSGGYKQNGIGYLKASPDGTKIGIVHSQTSFSNQSGPKTQSKQTGKVLVYDFDSATGQVSNEISLLNNRIPYGLGFSPNTTKLYTTVNAYDPNGNPVGSSLFQYDLLAANIPGSQVEINSSSNVAGALQLAIDGKIYRAGYPTRGSATHISVINDPESKGIACNYQSNVVSLGGQLSELGLPPFVQSFFILKFDYQNVCLGDNTEFTILGDAPFHSVEWDFGDGQTSTEEEPIHRYQFPGEYEVTLTKFINGNPSDSLKKLVTIFDVPKVPTETVEYFQCSTEESSNEFGTINLNQINQTVSLDIDQVINVFYYHDLESAQQDFSNINALPYTYANGKVGEILVAKVYNPISGCYDFAEVSLNLKETISVNGPSLLGCDLGNGLGNFNLESARQNILDSFDFSADADIKFYEDKNDALQGTENYLPDNYQSSPTVLFIRISEENVCSALGEFRLQLADLNIETEETVMLCSSNGLETAILDPGVEEGAEYAYLWSSGETTPTISVNSPGAYTVKVSNNLGCSIERTVTVILAEPPQIKKVRVSNDVVEIITQQNGNYEYAVGSIEGPYQNSNVFLGVPTGKTLVHVRKKDNCGVVSKEILVIAYPRFFTPNGDLVNDFWKIDNLIGDLQPESPIFIFDRFGSLLGRLDPMSLGWDGTFKGKHLTSSDYWFKVNLTGGKNLKGHFSLKR